MKSPSFIRSHRLLAAASLVCIGLSPNLASAADYFVATDGDDGADGTESRPFLTLRRAVDAASQPGDTVWIRGGVYEVTENWENQLNFMYSGEPGNPITFRNYPGELPILDGSALWDDGASAVEIVEPAEEPVSHIRIIGLVARNWGTSGFSNGWYESEPNLASSDIQFINCIADHNGVNGFSFTGGRNLLIEGSITIHNGTRLPSWSSGVSLLAATGENYIIGNVAVENTDVSDNRTDGSGFIADESTMHAYFASNIALRNGGSCVRVTLSQGVTVINTTCYENGQENLLYNDEIYLSEEQSGNGTSIYNTVIVQGNGANIFGGNGFEHGNPTVANTVQWQNASQAGGSFVDAASGDFNLTSGASSLVNQGQSNYVPDTAIGFDPNCLMREQGELSWWQYAVDYDYVRSVGGVAGCFNPTERNAGGGVDIGAYELDGAPVGCSSEAECDDGNMCTEDMCAPGNKCTSVPIEGCCIEDADCNDGDECTADSCDTGANQCLNEVDPLCGENVSGDWSFSSGSDYVSVCNWHGFAWTAAGPEEEGLNGSVSSIEEVDDLCYSGTVAAHEGYNGYAMLGVNIAQDNGAGTEAMNIVPGGDGLNISIDNKNKSLIRIQLQDAPDEDDAMNSWCVELDGAGGFFAWSEFNTECWDVEGENAEFYAGEPINVIAVMVAGHNDNDRDFDFCLKQFSPSNEECLLSCTSLQEEACGEQCVDTSSDESHCGACDNACGANEECVDGECDEITCEDSGLDECNEECVNLDSNAEHCGECDNACEDSLVCSDGECTDSCAEGLTVCDQACADLDEDADNCGECGNECDAGDRCSSGECVERDDGGSDDDGGDSEDSEDSDGDDGGDSDGDDDDDDDDGGDTEGDPGLAGGGAASCACRVDEGGFGHRYGPWLMLPLLRLVTRRRRSRRTR